MMRVYQLLLICLVSVTIAVADDQANKPLTSWLTLRNLQAILTKVTQHRSSDTARSNQEDVFSNVNDILSTSTSKNEGWTTFGKRMATFLLGGKEEALEDERALNTKLAKSLYEKSPQIMKDVVQYKQSGSIMPIVEKRLTDIAISMKEAENQTLDGKSSPQGKAVDPFVVGANGLINLGWATALILGMGPSMGIENLFNPDYDFDYDAYETDQKAKKEARQKAEELEICRKHRNKPKCKKLLEEAAKAAPPVPLDYEFLGPDDFTQATAGRNPPTGSSYVYYPGQNLQLQQPEQDPSGYYLFQLSQKRNSNQYRR